MTDSRFHPPAEVPQFYTPAQAAKILQVTPRTVYSWLRSGRLNGSIRIGRTWRVRIGESK